MVKDDDFGPVACTLTTEEEAERAEAVHQTLVSRYLGTMEQSEGYTFRFTGSVPALDAVATFVSNELQCCSFATYTIEIEPPYEETRLTVSGPEGTKGLFADLVDRLENGVV